MRSDDAMTMLAEAAWAGRNVGHALRGSRDLTAAEADKARFKNDTCVVTEAWTAVCKKNGWGSHYGEGLAVALRAYMARMTGES